MAFEACSFISKVEQPKNCHILDKKWRFSIKSTEECEINKLKAKLVRGLQKDGNHKILGNQFSYKQQLNYHQLNVKTAFLNVFLIDDIYIYPSKGVSSHKNQTVKLRKSLYGLSPLNGIMNKIFITYWIL